VELGVDDRVYSQIGVEIVCWYGLCRQWMVGSIFLEHLSHELNFI
jgi:hypothetical protein